MVCGRDIISIIIQSGRVTESGNSTGLLILGQTVFCRGSNPLPSAKGYLCAAERYILRYISNRISIGIVSMIKVFGGRIHISHHALFIK